MSQHKKGLWENHASKSGQGQGTHTKNQDRGGMRTRSAGAVSQLPLPPLEHIAVMPSRPPPMQQTAVMSSQQSLPPMHQTPVVSSQPPPMQQRAVMSSQLPPPPMQQTDVVSTQPPPVPVNQTAVMPSQPPPMYHTQPLGMSKRAVKKLQYQAKDYLTLKAEVIALREEIEQLKKKVYDLEKKEKEQKKEREREALIRQLRSELTPFHRPVTYPPAAQQPYHAPTQSAPETSYSQYTQ